MSHVKYCSTIYTATMLLLLLSIGLPKAATADSSLAAAQQLQQWVESQQSDKAYRWAQAHRFNHEGHPAFDAWYGLAALNSGRLAEAQYAFERVLLAQPDNQRIQLELGRCLYQQGNLEAAKQLFSNILAQQPPQGVRATVQDLLTRIQQQQRQRQGHLSASASLHGGYDSNVNSATTDSIIAVPLLGQLNLSDEGRETSDQFYTIQARANWLQPTGKRSGWMLGGGASQRDVHTLSQYDLSQAHAVGAYQYAWGQHNLSTGLRYQSSWLDGERYQTNTSVFGQWQRPLADNRLSVDAVYSQLRYSSDPLRDVDQHLLMLSHQWRLEQSQHHLGVLGSHEQAKYAAGEHNAKQLAGLYYHWQYSLPQSHQWWVRWQLQHTEHHANHPLFGRERHDTLSSISAGWSWQWQPQLQLRLVARHHDNRSNLPLFTYRRHVIEAGVHYAW